MPEIGLFPLGMVLLPTERLALHVFEPRYQELVGECLERETEFGLVYAHDDGMRAIGTRATVAEVTARFADGRLDIVVTGAERFRLERLTEGRSFQTGIVEPLVDVDDPAHPGDVARARRLFGRLVELSGAEAKPPRSDALLSFALAGRFEFSPDLEQELLELTSERERLRRVCELFQAAVHAVERQREIATLARANGHGRT